MLGGNQAIGLNSVYTIIVCLCFIPASCSHKHVVSRKVLEADVIGHWYLTPDSARRLKWEGKIGDTEAPRCFITFQPSGQCEFHSYSASVKRFVDGSGRWWIDHEVSNPSIGSISNVVRMSIPIEQTRQIESLNVGATGKKLVLWSQSDNGWGDEVLIEYTQK
jgi:hypothetical protein